MTSDSGKQFIFFGGKGGTGKTTCAGAYALKKAEEGNKVLVVSTDPAHSLSDAFNVKIGSAISKISDNLWGLEVDAKVEAKKYMEGIQEQMLEIVSASIVEEIKKQLDIAYMSPGAEEAAIFDKFIEVMEMAGKDFDLMVFDTAPTGHTLRLLTLPEILGVWIEHLISRHKKARQLMKMSARYDKILKKKLEDDPIIQVLQKRRDKFTFGRDKMTDSNLTEFFFVLNAEKMPILETVRAIELLEEFSIPIGGVVVNKMFPPETGPFFEKKRLAQEEYLKDIRERFKEYTIATLPILRSDIRGMDELEEIAHLMSSLG